MLGSEKVRKLEIILVFVEKNPNFGASRRGEEET